MLVLDLVDWNLYPTSLAITKKAFKAIGQLFKVILIPHMDFPIPSYEVIEDSKS